MTDAADWRKILRAIAPRGKGWIINGMADAMPEVIRIADLSTPRRLAHFLAQCAHESDGFSTTKEYASGAAYEGREDLGNIFPGDGRRFPGRGVIQNTGRGGDGKSKPLSGYNLLSKVLGVDFIKNPEKLEQFPYAALGAAIFWKSKPINRAADRDDIDAVTKLVNGGKRGLPERKAYLKTAKRVLAQFGVTPAAAKRGDEVTAESLRKAGSRTVQGGDQVKNNLVGAGASAAIAAGTAVFGDTSSVSPTDALSAASDAASKASGVASNVKNIHESASGLGGMVAGFHWEWAVMVALFVLCAYFAWRTWHGANKVISARVDDANEAIEAEDELEDEAEDEEAATPTRDYPTAPSTHIIPPPPPRRR